jgi:hypothetical protein
MEETNQEDWLDRQLRNEAPYIDDNGFTARVIAGLSPRRRASRSFRPVILLSLTVLGSVLAYVLSDGGRFVVVNMHRLVALSPIYVLLFSLGSGILVMTGGLIAAITKSRELQS